MERAIPRLAYARPPDTRVRAIVRAAGLTVYALLSFSMFWNGMADPETFGISLLGFAIALSLGVGYELSVRNFEPNIVLAIVLAIPTVTGVAQATYSWLFPPPVYLGPLLPANEPSPPMTCVQAADANDLVIAFGSNRVIAKGQGPFVPLGMGECRGPVITRAGNGILVDAPGYDWNNDLAWHVRANRLDFNGVPGLRARRPDAHSLVLLDRFDHEVLYVRYLNPGAVKLRGRFLCAEQPQVVFDDARVLVGGVRIGGVMFGQHPTRGHVCATATGPDPAIAVGR